MSQRVTFRDVVSRTGKGRVLFLDDFTRSEVNGLPYYVTNRRWLRGLFRGALEEAGFGPGEWGAETHADDVAAFMTLLGLPPSGESWAQLTLRDALPPPAEAWLDGLIGDAFVVGFELPPFLIRHLCRRGNGFLDVTIDPVRFARDLFLAVRTNDRALAARLADCEADENILWADAALLRGQMAHEAPPRPAGEEVVVFFGQTNRDRSLIHNGRLATPMAAAERLAALGRPVLIRRHPSEETPDPIDALLRALPDARTTEENSYALLSREDVVGVVALSSSLLTEARYFRKPATAVIVPDINNPALLPVACSRWYRVGAGVLTPGFWHGEAVRVPPVPDQLRISLNAFWGRERKEAATVARMDAELASLRHEFADLRRESADQQAAGSAEIERIRAEASEKAAELARMAGDLAASRAEIAALHSSTSWRVTAPLRAVRHLWTR